MAISTLTANSYGAGTISNAALASGAVTNASIVAAAGIATTKLGTGAILQVVTVNKTDTFSMSSQTWTDVTGLSASITPSSASNKVLVLASVAIASSTDFAYIRLSRNGTAIDIGDAAGSRPRVTGAFGSYNSSTVGTQYDCTQVPVTYLDSPASTSAVTYNFQIRSGSSAFAVYINRTPSDRDTADYEWRMPSNIVLMEIAG